MQMSISTAAMNIASVTMYDYYSRGAPCKSCCAYAHSPLVSFGVVICVGMVRVSNGMRWNIPVECRVSTKCVSLLDVMNKCTNILRA